VASGFGEKSGNLAEGAAVPRSHIRFNALLEIPSSAAIFVHGLAG
jgi:hypothetical protein